MHELRGSVGQSLGVYAVLDPNADQQLPVATRAVRPGRGAAERRHRGNLLRSGVFGWVRRVELRQKRAGGYALSNGRADRESDRAGTVQDLLSGLAPVQEICGKGDDKRRPVVQSHGGISG